MPKQTVLLSPRKYIQGRGVLQLLPTEASRLGSKPALLWDTGVESIVGEQVLTYFREAGCEPTSITFHGEASRGEAERIGQALREQGADCLIGLGGGKTMDVTKAAAHYAEAATVTVPTIASNDSPCSSFTVWYTDEGKADGYDTWGQCPDLVLVDTQVIVAAPIRTFISGLGDALATWFEADAAFRSRSGNLVGGQPTAAALALAKLCCETVLEYGESALEAVRQKVVTHAVEKVVESTVLHSGVGFESGGLATAHQIANYMPVFEECHGIMHGEEVAFGLLTQMCLDEDADPTLVNDVVDFMIRVGLPVTFKELGLENVSRERLYLMGNICEAEGSFCHNHSFEVTADDVVDAMIAANQLGESRA